MNSKTNFLNISTYTFTYTFTYKTISIFIFVTILNTFISSLVAAEGKINPRLIGQDCSSQKPSDYSDAKELKIEYMGRENATYSRASPSKIQKIVFHDPGNSDCGSILRLVEYGQRANSRPECGGG